VASSWAEPLFRRSEGSPGRMSLSMGDPSPGWTAPGFGMTPLKNGTDSDWATTHLPRPLTCEAAPSTIPRKL